MGFNYQVFPMVAKKLLKENVGIQFNLVLQTETQRFTKRSSLFLTPRGLYTT